MPHWVPREIIINEEVREDPVTRHILSQCAGVPVAYVDNGRPQSITQASSVLQGTRNMLKKIMAGKHVLYIGPAGNDPVDRFEINSARMMCPHFDRLKLASNGCFYACEWCYLKLTYRSVWPFIAVRAGYNHIKERLAKKIKDSDGPAFFNSGELADSLSLDHLTRAGREFIPWFAQQANGYLFMLTKSDNVEDILELAHNGHTVVCWSLNNSDVSRKFEVGAPSFERRLEAARKVQEAGYPIRVRLDPIVPLPGWQEMYADTIRQIFRTITPDRITLGTLRFEKGFYRTRKNLLSPGSDLLPIMQDMTPMFAGTDGGKYSFPEEERISVFRFAIDEIRKYSHLPIALCKESPTAWVALGMDLSNCQCVCQLDGANMRVTNLA